MTTELFLSATLTAYGNAYLYDCLSAAEKDFLHDHPLTPYVSSIRMDTRPPEPVAVGVVAWLKELRDAGAVRLWLIAGAPGLAERPAILEAFANSMPRGILVELPNEPYVLFSRWHFGHSQEWAVAYERVPLTTLPQFATPDCADAIESLRQKTAAARDFAADVEQGYLVEWLGAVVEMLGREAAEQRFLPACGYSNQARLLIAAANRAWVFGGMGSWNDLWFADAVVAQRYTRVTDEFYDAVLNAIFTAVNSFAPLTRRIPIEL